MTRTNIDIDDTLVANVMRRYHVKTKKEAVDIALRLAYLEPMTTEEALSMQGSGAWVGDIDEIKSGFRPIEL